MYKRIPPRFYFIVLGCGFMPKSAADQAKKSQKKPKKSPEQLALEAEYRKLRKSRSASANRLLKKGYALPSNIIPKIPQKITAGSIRELKKRDTKYMMEKAVYVSEQGTLIPGTVRRGQERREASQKGVAKRRATLYNMLPPDMEPGEGAVDWGRVMWTNVTDKIYSLPEFDLLVNSPLNPPPEWGQELRKYKENDLTLIRNIWNKAQKDYNYDDLMNRIEANAERINQILEDVLKTSGDTYVQLSGPEHTGINRKIQELAEIIKGGPLTAKESLFFTSQGEANGSQQEI